MFDAASNLATFGPTTRNFYGEVYIVASLSAPYFFSEFVRLLP